MKRGFLETVTVPVTASAAEKALVHFVRTDTRAAPPLDTPEEQRDADTLIGEVLQRIRGAKDDTLSLPIQIQISGLVRRRALQGTYFPPLTMRPAAPAPAPISGPPPHYYYLGRPLELLLTEQQVAQLPYNLPPNAIVDWTDNPVSVSSNNSSNTMEETQRSYIQPPHECLTLAGWIASTIAYYGVADLLRPNMATHPHRDLIRVLDYYRGDAFDEINTELALGTQRRDDTARFLQSFATLGQALPRTHNWTLFTGEGVYGTVLWDLCRQAQEEGRAVDVPVQVSTSWNFNVALSFMQPWRAGLVALHYRAGSDGSESPRVMAHLLQELACYVPKSCHPKPYECEILLQPRLRLRFRAVETVPAGMIQRSIMRYGAAERVLSEFRILHMDIVGGD